MGRDGTFDREAEAVVEAEMLGDHGEVAARPIGVACDIDYDHFDFPPQIAAPVALIANERVVNALEHGFGRDRTGTLRIGVSPKWSSNQSIRSVRSAESRP